MSASHHTGNAAIELKDVSFKYGNSSVLENITASVHEGEYLGIIGPNGGGKTTLLKLILGLLKPTSGSIEIYGQPVSSYAGKAKIGYVPQRAATSDYQFPATVEEIVLSGRTAKAGLLKRFSAEDRKQVKKALEIAGISNLGDRLLSNLSGGERQRVYIARALACEPKILILDEPTVAIDIVSQEKFYNFLDDLHEKLGLTILFVSHDIDVVAQQVETVLCLNRGLVCHGTPAQFIKDEYLEKLYGKKVKFILHGH